MANHQAVRAGERPQGEHEIECLLRTTHTEVLYGEKECGGTGPAPTGLAVDDEARSVRQSATPGKKGLHLVTSRRAWVSGILLVLEVELEMVRTADAWRTECPHTAVDQGEQVGGPKALGRRFHAGAGADNEAKARGKYVRYMERHDAPAFEGGLRKKEPNPKMGAFTVEAKSP